MIIRNTRRKPFFSRPRNENGIATLPLPLNAVVAQCGASVGIPHKYYGQRKSGGGDKKSSLLGRQASQTAFRLPLKTGEPVPLLGLQEKGWRQTASQFTSDGQCPPILRHLLRWTHRCLSLSSPKNQVSFSRKILGSEKEKSLDNAYIQGGVTGVRESFKTE